MNIKKHREIQGMSQEKLAEKAGISSNMVKDIEGCRTWVSDKTLINLAYALETDIYRLFISAEIYEEEIYKTVIHDVLEVLKKVKTDVIVDIEKSLSMWDLR